MRLTSTRLFELLKAYENKHGEGSWSSICESDDLARLRAMGLVEAHNRSNSGTRTTLQGDLAVEQILEAVEKIEIEGQL